MSQPHEPESLEADPPPRYRPAEPGPFRWRLGLRPLEPARWLEPGPDREHQLAVKERVLADHHGTAFAALDGVEDEAAEVLDAVVAHLRLHGPDHDVRARTDVHPLDAAGRLIQEDLVLLVPRGDRLVVGAGSVCFPNRWDLRAKIGRTMTEVHAPVARLNEQLADPIDRFLGRLGPERGFWRLGWGVLDTDELYQATDGTAPHGPGDGVAPEHTWLRVERETLRRFPRTEAVLFTIRTHLTPIPVIRSDRDDARRLAAALASLPDDVAEYKQLDVLGARVAALLRT